jgi:hypothetical protein
MTTNYFHVFKLQICAGCQACQFQSTEENPHYISKTDITDEYKELCTPRCDKCNKKIESGLMALGCDFGGECDLFVDLESPQAVTPSAETV